MAQEGDLLSAATRLRQLGGVVAVEELSGAIGDNSPGADELDGTQATRAVRSAGPRASC